MHRSTYFNQECPICGRGLRVRVEYQGKNVYCQHCKGQFLACDPSGDVPEPSDSGIGLLRRADELLLAAKKRQVG